MVLITIVTGAYKPTYNWGASHCNYGIVHGHIFIICFMVIIVKIKH